MKSLTSAVGGSAEAAVEAVSEAVEEMNVGMPNF